MIITELILYIWSLCAPHYNPMDLLWFLGDARGW